MEQHNVTAEELDKVLHDKVVEGARKLYDKPNVHWEATGIFSTFAPYCIMRSVERQEELMHRMEKQQKVMKRLTIAMIVLTVVITLLTAAVVALALMTAFPSIANKITG